MGESLCKILIKVLDTCLDRGVWVHVCYAPKDLYLEFLEAKCIERREFADYICKWVKRDFRMNLPMTTMKDVNILRKLIRDRYKTIYPNIYLETAIDRQAWMRVWVTENMKRELGKR